VGCWPKSSEEHGGTSPGALIQSRVPRREGTDPQRARHAGARGRGNPRPCSTWLRENPAPQQNPSWPNVRSVPSTRRRALLDAFPHQLPRRNRFCCLLTPLGTGSEAAIAAGRSSSSRLRPAVRSPASLAGTDGPRAAQGRSPGEGRRLTGCLPAGGALGAGWDVLSARVAGLSRGAPCYLPWWHLQGFPVLLGRERGVHTDLQHSDGFMAGHNDHLQMRPKNVRQLGAPGPMAASLGPPSPGQREAATPIPPATSWGDPSSKPSRAQPTEEGRVGGSQHPPQHLTALTSSFWALPE